MNKIYYVILITIVFSCPKCFGQDVSSQSKENALVAATHGTVDTTHRTTAELIFRSDVIFVAHVVSGQVVGKKNCYRLSIDKFVKGSSWDNRACSSMNLRISGKYIVFGYVQDGDQMIGFAMQVLENENMYKRSSGGNVVVGMPSLRTVKFLLPDTHTKEVGVDYENAKNGMHDKICIYSYYPYSKVASYIKSIVADQKRSSLLPHSAE